MAEEDVVIRISARSMTKAAFDDARKQLAALEKTAGLTNTGFGNMGKGFQGAAQQLASFNPVAGQASGLLAGFGAAGVAAGAGIGVLALGLRSLAAEGDRLERLARETQMTTDELQRLEAIGGRLGITLPELTSASVKLETALGKGGKEVAEAVAAIGFSIEELGGKGATDRLLAVQRGIAGIKDPILQAEVGAALLGKSWANLRAELSDIEAAQTASENVLRLSENALDAGDNLGDAWGEATRNLKVLMLEGLTPLAEDLAEVLDWLTKSTKAWQEFDDSVPEWLKRGAGQSMPGDVPVPFTFGQLSFGVSPGEQKMIQDAENEQRRKTEFALVNDEIVARAQEEFNAEREEKEKKFAELQKKAAEEAIKDIVRLSEAHAKAAGEAWMFWDAAWDRIEQSRLDADIDSALQGFGPLGFSGGTGLDVRGRFAGQFLGSNAPGVDFSSFGEGAEVAQASLGDLSNELANLAHLSDVLGPKLAAVFQGLSTGLAGLESIQGGIGSIRDGGFMNTLAGIGGIASGIGAIAAPIVALIQGLGGPDIGRDVGRDIGANISEELEAAIEESGENAQMFLREIWQEGGLGIDRLAEETADLFSMFERGEISKESLIGELQETVPILIEHFKELGPEGQAQLERLTAPADSFGLELVEVER